MNFESSIIGIAVLLIFGVFHPVVIKTEYHVGVKAWPIFLVAGIIALRRLLLFPGLCFQELWECLDFSVPGASVNCTNRPNE
jgi:hypothetical protein